MRRRRWRRTRRAAGRSRHRARRRTPRPPADEDEIVVTATKRSENLQDVPIAITALSTKTLDDLQVDSFDDYAKLVPSLSFKSSGPGIEQRLFPRRRLGENANHSASLPSVGTYLDEQPITTIQGALDLHVFDIARVEALAGPQGTLYGASSQAGTVRIITNKPDFTGTLRRGQSGGEQRRPRRFRLYRRRLRQPADRDQRRGARGRLVPQGRRLHRQYRRAALTFPTSGITFDNADLAENDYNDVDDLWRARRAARSTSTTIGRSPRRSWPRARFRNGSFAEESGLGDLETMQFNPEKYDDKWWQAALTVEGKIANFDVTYAGSYMKRQIDGEFDYSDYAYFYDALYGYGAYFYDNDGDPVNPNQYIQSDDALHKQMRTNFASPRRRQAAAAGRRPVLPAPDPSHHPELHHRRHRRLPSPCRRPRAISG